MDNSAPTTPQWAEMTTQELLVALHARGYGAKRLSRALGGALHYRSLHRWKAGKFKPRHADQHALILSFAKQLEEWRAITPTISPTPVTKQQGDCPF